MTFYIHRNERLDNILYIGMKWHDTIKLPPPTILTVPWDMRQYNQWITIYKWYLQFEVTFLVVSECVCVEEWFAMRGTHQSHPQVYFAHMCADHSMWGWWSLFATFNLASVHSFDAPSWIQRGHMLAGRASSGAGEAASDACSAIFGAGSETSGVIPVGSWGGRWETVVDRMW